MAAIEYPRRAPIACFVFDGGGSAPSCTSGAAAGGVGQSPLLTNGYCQVFIHCPTSLVIGALPMQNLHYPPIAGHR